MKKIIVWLKGIVWKICNDCNKSKSQILDAKTKQNELVDKSAIAEFINNADIDKKAAKSPTKAELNQSSSTIKLCW